MNWISVKDRLPELGIKVIVTDGINYDISWIIAYPETHCLPDSLNRLCNGNPTHYRGWKYAMGFGYQQGATFSPTHWIMPELPHDERSFAPLTNETGKDIAPTPGVK